MLFEKHLEPRCAYCAKSTALDEKTMLCRKRGVVSAAGRCISYRYDPLKRVPPRPVAPDFSKLDPEDFTL